ncbi:phosphoinositide phospholipase C 4-like isoform X2 [Carica papaya]|uniref:phosphoinositide phospholipase C 4-like isoform X2 n=1 Tax=Carica papaya TaxID=3649 RepID=UPI000B8CE901|nr:phosphoinositide phospholipase C 4-like isoform X2 [Carica papaya]
MGRETEIEAVSSRTRGLFRSKLGVTEAAPPEDVKKVFDRYAQGETEMSVDQLRRFLVEFLEEGGTTLAEAKKIVEAVLLRGQRLIPNFARKTQTNTFTLDDFHHYLSSADLNPPIGDQVHHDMTAPLSHYFIYTGYNSYLTGNLLSGECSDIPIINALKRGVRVVELDLWPDSTKNDVIVFHGRWFSKVSTSTTQLSLIKCLKSIKEHAFSASPYPVIIILEDHLAKNLQDKVCQAFRGIFGDMLFSGKNLQEFPSPEDLKHRIIILTKPSTEYLEEANINYQKDNSQTEKASDHDVQRKKPEARADQEDNEQDGSIMDLINHNNENIEGNDPESDSVAASAYKSLIVVNAGKPKGALEEALKVEPNKVRCLSLAEQALEKAVSSHGAHIVRCTRKNILRIYPRRNRFNLSNSLSLVGWMHGAQMVAFNMQEHGRSLWLMHGMFKSNGGCGYVRKPCSLLKFGPRQVYLKAEVPARKNLKVKVYQADGYHLDLKQTRFETRPPDWHVKNGGPQSTK